MDALYFYLTDEGTIMAKSAETEGSYHVKMIAISRVRDKSTGKERLAVELYDKQDDPEPYAAVSCGLRDLHGDLVALREYGFLVKRKNIQHLARIIEEKYLKMSVTIYEGARTLENDIYDILRFICEYVRDNHIEAKTVRNNKVYCIPVEAFSGTLKHSQFARYRITDVRRMLSEMEYTVCSPGRYDYTIKDESKKPIKVMALCADSTDITDIMQEISYENLQDELIAELEEIGL